MLSSLHAQNHSSIREGAAGSALLCSQVVLARVSLVPGARSLDAKGFQRPMMLRGKERVALGRVVVVSCASLSGGHMLHLESKWAPLPCCGTGEARVP